MLPSTALAQAVAAGRAGLIGSGNASVPGWWGAAGRPGWLPDGDLGTGYPWTLAGLVAGAWVLDQVDRTPAVIPPPGVAGAADPLVWCDSLAVLIGEGGGWEGFDAGLASARVGPPLDARPADGWRPRADFLLANASRGLRDHALSLWRGDTLGGFRAEAASGERGPAGGLGGTGRDLYGIAGARVRGAHRIEATFTHRRAEAFLAGGESQDARGEAGSGGYRFRGARWRVAATFARGYDRHDSRGDSLPEQRRLTGGSAAVLELERARPRGRWGLRWSWRGTRIAPASGVTGRERASAHWGAARWLGPFGDGDLEIALGVGRHDALTGGTIAPSLVWRFNRSPWEGRMMIERLPTPVWADLAPGQTPFLQDSWTGGIQLGTHLVGEGRARLGFLAGHTRGRALLPRHPLESLALRSGFRADPRPYDFGLLTGEASWRVGRWRGGVEGYLLARDASVLQPWVDPGRGSRAFFETQFGLFGGDLRVRPRVEVWAVGPRESEAVPSRALSGYLTSAAGLELTLADAVVLIEGRNLEDRVRPQTWVDSVTHTEALGAGRELRVSLLWRLWD